MRFKSILIILLSCLTLTGFAQQKIALLEPCIEEGSSSVSTLERNILRGELRNALGNYNMYEVFTRTDIDQMMNEQNFQRTGLVSDEQIKKLGEMSGADYICVSKLTKENTEFYLEAYVIHLESGKIYTPVSQYGEIMNGNLSNLLPACQTLAKKLVGDIQDNKENDQPPLRFADKTAEFPGGTTSLSYYLQTHLRYPADAIEAGVSGTVLVEFVVEADGHVSNAKIVTSVSPSLDEEALRIVRSLPDWEPGERDGKRVALYYQIPITFKL